MTLQSLRPRCSLHRLALLLILALAGPAARAADPAWSDPAKLAPPPAGAVGYPSRAADLDALPGFQSPPAGYGEVPFWWWNGDTLTKERIAWELDQLKIAGISALQVNYCHRDTGGRSYGLTFPSDPKLFTPEWWSIYNWTAAEARKRGMALSLSDYTLGLAGQGAYVDEILKDNPGLIGHMLARVEKTVAAGKAMTLDTPEGTLSVTAIPVDAAGNAQGAPLNLTARAAGGRLQWTAPAGHDWKIVAVQDKAVPLSLDPMDPRSGKETIRTFYQRFEDQNPGEAGKSVNFFFSDELQFGVSGNLWNDRFAAEFQKRKGYDIRPELAALYTDIGPRTPKIRLDYNDVLVALSEESYFRPVFEWHYSRGMLYGCDHGGRGKNTVEFGDYFRTQRWMTGPGADQPRLAHDQIKNKVAASIAHLYQRPRAWCEEFHSTGWSADTDRMTLATNENFVGGMNLLTLHGLYYTTHGGWWEWAPPDFHFRMPYWPHMAGWLRAYERLSYLMSQGVHACDVAILYPVSPLQAGMAQMPGKGRRPAGDNPVNLAFSMGETLFDRGIDFDFMDEDSLARARVQDKALQVSGERYRVLVLPSMSAVRQATLDQALAFHRAGGIVIALGDLPAASDRAGRDDKELDAKVKAIFGLTAAEAERAQRAEPQRNTAGGLGLLAANPVKAAETIGDTFTRDFEVRQIPPEARPPHPHVNHRRVGTRDVFMVTQAPKGAVCFFRAKGKAELWDFWTGQTRPLPVAAVKPEGTLVRLPLSDAEAQLIVFSPGEPEKVNVANASVSAAQSPATTVALDGEWEFELKPTLDNRFGDFRLPATAANRMIGAEARQFKFCENPGSGDWNLPAFNDGAWRTETYGHGPHFLKIGPIKTDGQSVTPAVIEKVLLDPAGLAPNVPGMQGAADPNAPGDPFAMTMLTPEDSTRAALRPQPYEYSLREGVWGEPGHQGYHGLKESVSDDFIMLGRKVPARGRKNDVDFVAESGGTRYYLRAFVYAPAPCRARILVGDYKPSAIWLNGKPVLDFKETVQVTGNGDLLLLRYDKPGRGHFVLQDASVAPATPAAPYPLAMKWFTLPGVLTLDSEPQLDTHASANPMPGGQPGQPGMMPPGGPMASTAAYRFTAPPGLRGMHFTVFLKDDPANASSSAPALPGETESGPIRIWADGQPLTAQLGPRRPDGSREVLVALAEPRLKPSVIALWLAPRPGYRGGAAFPEPIQLDCGPGRLPTGDWSKTGVLATYSGGAWYRKTFTLSPAQAKQAVTLNLGRVVSTAEVFVNGRRAGLKLAQPWTLDITSFIKPGDNRVEILVYNTLANHYATIPTNYRGDATSGLLGPVALELK